MSIGNYTEILKQVDGSGRAYLTKNGQGGYENLTMEELDELDRYRTMHRLIAELKKAEECADKEGWICHCLLLKVWQMNCNRHKNRMNQLGSTLVLFWF